MHLLTIKANRKWVQLALLSLSMLLIAACRGGGGVVADLEAAGEMQHEETVEPQEAVLQEAAPQIEEEGQVEADMEAEAETNFDPASFPPIVPGDPSFHETDPAQVSLDSGSVQLVEFFAYWCPTCKAIAPTVHGLEKIYGDRVNFVYLDRDKPATAELREALGYVYQPHIFLLDADGNVLANWVGYVEGPVLQEAIELALN